VTRSGSPPNTEVSQRAVGGLPESKLRRVTAHIESNLQRELPLAELASVANMSPYHFARLFKRATGVSPHRFVVRRRMDAAIVLLTESTSPISSIARAVGFRTASHFTTTVRRITGRTPSGYRAGRAGGEPAGATSRVATADADGGSPTLPR